MLEVDNGLGGLEIKVERTDVVPELIARARRFGADALFVDYATLFRMPGVPGSNYLNYEQVVSSTMKFAEMTKEMFVVVASQVNSLEPDLYNLQWGKMLPDRANVVLWLDRNLTTGITMVHVLKNKGGPIGKVPYYVLPASMQPIELSYVEAGYSMPLAL